MGAALIGACSGPPAASNGQSAGPSVSVTASGTAGPAVTPSASGSPAAGTSLPAGWRRCVNTVEGYSIGYPGGWYTTQIRPEEVCTQFHPSVFTIPRQSEYPLTALNARRVAALPGRTDTPSERVLLWEETTVAGRRAVRFETSSTGEGLYLAGTRSYGYVIRLGNGLVSVHTTASPGESGYPAWKVVVDRAARTLLPR